MPAGWLDSPSRTDANFIRVESTNRQTTSRASKTTRDARRSHTNTPERAPQFSQGQTRGESPVRCDPNAVALRDSSANPRRQQDIPKDTETPVAAASEPSEEQDPGEQNISEHTDIWLEIAKNTPEAQDPGKQEISEHTDIWLEIAKNTPEEQGTKGQGSARVHTIRPKTPLTYEAIRQLNENSAFSRTKNSAQNKTPVVLPCTVRKPIRPCDDDEPLDTKKLADKRLLELVLCLENAVPKLLWSRPLTTNTTHTNSRPSYRGNMKSTDFIN